MKNAVLPLVIVSLRASDMRWHFTQLTTVRIGSWRLLYLNIV
jgi:hypothetical protein